jgi:hypothetical protein
MPPEQWQTYLRYDTTISREFFKTLDALTKLQRVRQTKKPVTPPVPEPAPVLALAAGKLTADSCQMTALSQLSDSGTGSVLQHSSLPESAHNPVPAATPCLSSSAPAKTPDPAARPSLSGILRTAVAAASLFCQQFTSLRIAQPGLCGNFHMPAGISSCLLR